MLRDENIGCQSRSKIILLTISSFPLLRFYIRDKTKNYDEQGRHAKQDPKHHAHHTTSAERYTGNPRQLVIP